MFYLSTDDEDDGLSTSVIVAISVVVTFTITLVVSTLISIIVTRMCYKCQQEVNKKPKTDGAFENQFVLTNQNDSHAENPLYEDHGSSVALQSNPSYAGLTQAVKKQ